MKRGIAGLSLEGTDLLDSIDAAEKAGYDVIELRLSPVENFLKKGHTIEELADRFKSVSIHPHVICAVLDIEIPDGPRREELLAYYKQVCEIAAGIRCPNIQMVSGTTYEGEPWKVIRRETGRGLREMADIAQDYGVVALYEPIAWWPVRTVAQALEVAAEAKRDNIGILVDTFHIFAANDDLNYIRKLDPKILPTVHLGDCVTREGRVWSDNERYPMPGDGIIPLREIMGTILATGYDSVISDEIWPKNYADWDIFKLFRTLKEKGDKVLNSV